MKALVKYDHGPGRMEIREVPVPQPGRDEVLIKIAYCGICGTDLKIADGLFATYPPVIIGHEFSGVIEKAGPDVTGWGIGDRVVSEQHTKACGRCRFCLTGRRHLCLEKRSPGYGVDGAFAEYICLPASLLHGIPPEISLAEAALTEPMAVAAYGTLGRTGIRPEEFVVILGCGPVAILTLQMVKAEGASKVVMTGIDADEKSHFEIARKLGADKLINVMKQDPVAVVMEETGHFGADVVVDLAGSPAAILQGMDMLAKDGRLCAIGLPHGDVSVPWQKAVLKALRIIFSYSSDYESWERCLSMMQNRKVVLHDFIQDIYPLDEWEDAFMQARSGNALKVLIQPT
jgi:L-iditol 2-dehydrogenase